MKKIVIGFSAVIVLIGICAAVSLRSLTKDKLYDQKEIANELFRIRIAAYKERFVFAPGVYWQFQSAPIKTEKWETIMTVTGDEPIPIQSKHLSFVAPTVGYGFISSYYMVTTDAGANWTIWNGVKQIPDTYRTQNNLTPYIEEIEVHPDGTGRMRLIKFLTERERGPDIVTKDYGVNWYLKE